MTNIMLSALVFGLGYVTALYKLSLLLLLLRHVMKIDHTYQYPSNVATIRHLFLQ